MTDEKPLSAISLLLQKIERAPLFVVHAVMPGKSSEPLHHVPFTGALWVLTKAFDRVDSNDMTKLPQ